MEAVKTGNLREKSGMAWKIMLTQVQALLLSISTAYALTSGTSTTTTTSSSSATDIFDKMNTMLTSVVSKIQTLGVTVSIVVGVISAILYICSSNERTCQSAKSWFIRAVVGLFMIYIVTNNYVVNTIAGFF
ncbi:MAG: hypothetical protein LIO86_13880 [Lachnospiraceae bacterium]|nr:hypothetical protein [Lachnospiraceae bacterium]